MDIRLLHTEDDYRAALAEVSALVDLDPEAGTPDGDRLEILSTLVERYEAAHFPCGVTQQRIGFMKGQIKVPSDFDTMGADEIRGIFTGDSNDHDSIPEDQLTNHHWNYRVIETSQDGETWRSIHEVYYTNDVPTMYTVNPVPAMWLVEEGEPDGAVVMLDRMREALAKRVLTPADFHKADAASGDRTEASR
jgi:hypothetical protein